MAAMTATRMRVSDVSVLEAKHRSATLGVDPKNQELRHFVGSHVHEARLREAAGLNEQLAEKDIAAKVVLDVTAKEDHLERFDPMQNCRARLEWREEMDRNVRRLMQDQDLMLDDRMQETSKHSLRCGHLDKTYEWFQRHGKKEASKEKPHPSYLRYDANAPVMAGSMRKHSGAPGCWMPKPTATAAPGQTLRSVGKPSLMAAAAQSMNLTKPLAEAQPEGRGPEDSPKKADRAATKDSWHWKPRF